MEESSLKDALAVKYVAHYKASIKNGLFLYPEREGQPVRENKLVFPGANSIVANTLSSNFESERSQTFFHTIPGSKGVTCMTQSSNRKLLAWAEETDSFPIITCVDLLTGKKKLFATEIKAKRIISLAFNSLENGDSKLLVALTSGPEYSVIQWSFEKNKFVINVVEKVDKVERNDPLDKYKHVFFYREEDLVVLLGNGVFKILKLVNDKLQFKDSPFARKDISEKDFVFTSFAVLKDGLVVGTESGDILFFTVNCEFKMVIPNSPGEGASVDTILYLPNNKMFLAGCSDGQIVIYEKADLRNLYSRSEKILSLRDSKGKVTSLMTTSKEDFIFVGIQPGIILRSSIEKNEDWQFDVALQSFHTDTVTGLDICLRKPLFATCSLDRTVKIWNFAQKNNVEISKTFDEKASCLSFHPSGLHLAVCFPDKVKLINISNGDLVPYKDISQKSCYDVKFSNGGQLFAVANSVMVQVINFWTYEQAPGHQFKCQTGKFTYILWEEDDLGIFLGTSDGSVFYNKLEDSTVRLHVLGIAGFSVTSIYSLFVAKDEKQTMLNERVVYVSGIFNQAIESEQRCIFEVKVSPRSEKDREISKEDSKYLVSEPHKVFTSCNISTMSMLNSHKLFLYCTEPKDSPSSLRYCRFPFITNNEICEIQSHTSKVTKMRVCYDDGLVLTAGEDGSLVIYEVKDKDIKIKLEILDSAEQFLYSKTQLKAQKAQLEQLKVRNTDTRAKRDRTQREQTIEKERMQKEWRGKNKDREKVEEDKMEQLKKEMLQMEREQVKRLADLEQDHRTKREAVERDYAEKILLEQTRKTELAKTKEQEARTFNEILQATHLKHQQEKEQRTSQLKDQHKKESSEKTQLDEELSKMRSLNRHLQEGAEQESQLQVKVKIEDQEDSYRKMEEENMKAEAEARAKKTALEDQIKVVAEYNTRLSNTNEQLQKEKRNHEQLQQKKQSHGKEIEERQKTIRDKVTRIQQLKKKTQQLQKFKFVLDYKIKELKRDIGPREEEIAKMKEQIANMNAEIVHFKRTNDNMNLIVKDLVSKRHGMEQELSVQAQTESTNVQYIKSFETDVSEMVQGSLQDSKRLKAKMLEVFRKYVQDEDDKRKLENVDQQKEFIKERAHLESTVKGLKQKFRDNMKLHEADNKRIMGQNEDLISEINDLRRQKKNMLDEVKKRNQQKEYVKNLEEEKLLVEREGEDLRKRFQAAKTQYEQALKKKLAGAKD